MSKVLNLEDLIDISKWSIISGGYTRGSTWRYQVLHNKQTNELCRIEKLNVRKITPFEVRFKAGELGEMGLHKCEEEIYSIKESLEMPFETGITIPEDDDDLHDLV